MSEKVEKEYPLTLVHENGESVTVTNEVQAAAFEKAGFKEEKKKK